MSVLDERGSRATAVPRIGPASDDVVRDCREPSSLVRIAVVNPPFYSYQGPSGADRVMQHHAYTRSIVIDHDLDFTNEFAVRPPSSGAIFRSDQQLNKYPIGVGSSAPLRLR